MQSFGAGASLAAHLPRFLLLKNGSQVAPNRGIIINEKYANDGESLSSSDTDCKLRASNQRALARNSHSSPATVLPLLLPGLHHAAGRNSFGPRAVVWPQLPAKASVAAWAPRGWHHG